MSARNDALGRPWTSADHAVIAHFADCHRVHLYWNDGAEVYMIHDTREEAHEHMRQLGFYPTVVYAEHLNRRPE